MGLKKKLAMGIATGALAVSMIGGGTYAYFNDVEVNTSTFAAGKLDIDITGNDANNAIINVSNLKPGDYMERTFKLNNKGTLAISEVWLTSEYSVIDKHGDNAGRDFGADIQVDFLKNNDKGETVVISTTTLSELGRYDVVDNKNIRIPIFGQRGEADGLRVGDSDTLKVRFTFLDKGNQNVFQEDSLQLKWTFTAEQTAGEKR